MQIEGTSSIGLVRQNNQDRFAIIRHPELTNLTGCVVCDGVGGSNAGEVAASIAVEEFVKQFGEIKEYHSLKDLKEWILKHLELINEKIYNLAHNNLQFEGMSTTMVATIISEFGTLYLNIGDSRIYIVDKQNDLRLITNDHSLVFDMILKGSITTQEAKSHPLRNAVTNALGIYKKLRIDLNELKLPYRHMLLCSDGLHGYVDEAQIQQILLNETLSVRQRVIALVNEAEKVGGPDNITLVIVDTDSQGGKHGT